MIDHEAQHLRVVALDGEEQRRQRLGVLARVDGIDVEAALQIVVRAAVGIVERGLAFEDAVDEAAGGPQGLDVRRPRLGGVEVAFAEAGLDRLGVGLGLVRRLLGVRRRLGRLFGRASADAVSGFEVASPSGVAVPAAGSGPPVGAGGCVTQ